MALTQGATLERWTQISVIRNHVQRDIKAACSGPHRQTVTAHENKLKQATSRSGLFMFTWRDPNMQVDDFIKLLCALKADV